MKISWKWLNDFVDLSNHQPVELADALTSAGLEVESIEEKPIKLDHIVVGRVLRSQAVEGSKKLKLCQVSTGEQTHEVICGAPNVRAGIFAPLALPGAVMPNGLEIKPTKVGGVMSNGMLCSAVELGIGHESAGIMILATDSIAGESFEKHLRRFDAGRLDDQHEVVLELGITPNRGDCLSHLGVGREAGAAFSLPLQAVKQAEFAFSAESQFAALSCPSAACLRYSLTRIDGLRVGPSPRWLKNAIEACGARSVNNIVDVTNYVLFELGHPQHAFDAAKVSGEVQIRLANEGESLVAIDHQSYSLNTQDLVIADERGPIALAGVMGGAESEVSESTESIYLECAHFDPSYVRRTAKRLGLHSESSYRFERGVDPNGVPMAVGRTLELLRRCQEDLGNPAPLKIEAQDLYPEEVKCRELLLRTSRVNSLLGLKLNSNQILGLLRPLGIAAELAEEGLQLKLPTFRYDLEREIDLIEEVARRHGLNNLPTVLPEGELGYVHQHRQPVAKLPATPDTLISPSQLERERTLRQSLRNLGLHEGVHYAFHAEELAKAITPASEAIHIVNPLNAEQAVMRPSLLGGLINALTRNQGHQAQGVALFELGSVFFGPAADPTEKEHLALLLWGAPPKHWSNPEQGYDAYDLKGILEQVLGSFAPSLTFADVDEAGAPYLHPGVRLGIWQGQDLVGALGELHPKVIDLVAGLSGPVYVAELDASYLLQERPMPAANPEPPRLPASKRDLAFLVDRTLSFAAIRQVIEEASSDLLESWDIFDVYQGEHIEAGKKSVALSLVYRHPLAADLNRGRTLTDDEVNAAHSALVTALEQKLGAELR